MKFKSIPSVQLTAAGTVKYTQYKEPYTIYVSNTGSDDESVLGSSSEPVRTVQRAIDLAMSFDNDTNNTAYDSVYIELVDSEYIVEETLKFNKHNNLPIVMHSMGKSVLNGGSSFVGGWSEYKNGIYKRTIDKSSIDEDGFRQLYVDGSMATRSRFPNENTDYSQETLKGKWLDNTKEYQLPKEFRQYISNDNVQDVEVFIVEAWTQSIAKSKSVRYDGDKTILKFTDANEEKFYQKRYTKLATPHSWIENSLSLVDAENEWYYDDVEGELYYCPQEGVDINATKFTIPRTEKIIEIGGNEDISNIRLDNIAVKYSNWTHPTENGMIERQGNNHMYIDDAGNVTYQRPPSAIEVHSSHGVEIVNCTISSTGAGAIKYDGKSDDILIYYNDIYDVSAGALTIGDYNENEKESSSIDYANKNLSVGVVIADNVINRISRSYLGGNGILVGYVKDLVIDHNQISDGGYSGIAVGWGWAKDNHMSNYKVRNNRVENIINHRLFDGAGFYSLGTFSGEETNIVSGNYLDAGHGYAGLYFDEGSNNWEAKNNVIKEGTSGFLLIHDRDSLIKNVTVDGNYADTSKHSINNWSSATEKIKIDDRGVVIDNTYTPINNDFEKNCKIIYDNTGRRLR